MVQTDTGDDSIISEYEKDGKWGRMENEFFRQKIDGP